VQFFYRPRARHEYQTDPVGDVFPQIVLLRSDWNDFGWRTTFDMHLFAAADAYTRPGSVHIVSSSEDEKWTAPPSAFTELGAQYVALGSSLDLYRRLAADLGHDAARKVLAALRDVVVVPELRELAQSLVGFRTSALRSSEAEKAFHEAGVEFGLAKPKDEPFRFKFACQLIGFDDPHVVDFDFTPAREGDEDENIPHRLFCLVGKNGTGKSGVLAHLARTQAGIAKQGEGQYLPSRPLFRRTICVSYGVFQPFAVPKRNTISYRYCGYPDPFEAPRKQSFGPFAVLDADDEHVPVPVVPADPALLLETRTRAAFEQVIAMDRLEVWSRLVHLDDITGHLESYPTTSDELITCLSTLSTGQRMVATIATDLVANIDSQCLVLFDEPEVYLHPTLLSTLLRVLEAILKEYDSYAIIATHSPIVVQEVPSRNLRVFERVDDAPIIHPLHVESFGANLTDLIDRVFAMNPSDKNYQTHLRDAAKALGGPAAVIEAFRSPPLTPNALMFLESLAQKSKGDA